MKAIKYLSIALFAFSVTVNCNGKDKNAEESNKVKIGAHKDTKKADDNVANVVITGDDLMKFDKSEIRVKAGQKIKLTLRHIGNLNVQLMGHNVVILKNDVDPSEFAAMAATERDNGYIPKDSQDIIAHTELIGGGQVTSIEFDAPEVGIYEFLCSFPGHFGMMRGKFIVE